MLRKARIAEGAMVAARRRSTSGVASVRSDPGTELFVGPFHVGVVFLDVLAGQLDEFLVVGALQIVPTRAVDGAGHIEPPSFRFRLRSYPATNTSTYQVNNRIWEITRPSTPSPTGTAAPDGR